MYREIVPSKRLSCVIDSFWTYLNKEEPESFKVLPDSCTDLIFDLKRDIGFISGIMSKYQIRELEKGCHLIGIRLKAESFYSLTRIPPNEIKNLRTEIGNVFSKQDVHTISRLYSLKSIHDKISFLEGFVAQKLKENHQDKDELAISIAKNIRMLKGNLTIESLAIAHGVSLRQAERRFKNAIGLSPKEYANVIRFIHAREAISTSPKSSLLEIAFDGGFFDHSHMTYEFKRISGESPSSFR
ncbi:MAG: helix-turn-helix transcriptional regulator [Bacteroidota bacterium]